MATMTKNSKFLNWSNLPYFDSEFKAYLSHKSLKKIFSETTIQYESNLSEIVLDGPNSKMYLIGLNSNGCHY
jgi:hypothetical protein